MGDFEIGDLAPGMVVHVDLSPSDDTELLVPVKVLDVQARYGRLDILITPKGGRGEVWMQAARGSKKNGWVDSGKVIKI